MEHQKVLLLQLLKKLSMLYLLKMELSLSVTDMPERDWFMALFMVVSHMVVLQFRNMKEQVKLST